MTEFLLSGAAIAVLIGFAWALGFRKRPQLSDTGDATRLADAALTGFRAAEVVLDAQGHGALLRGSDGRLVLIRALGDRWVGARAGARRGDRRRRAPDAAAARTRRACDDARPWRSGGRVGGAAGMSNAWMFNAVALATPAFVGLGRRRDGCGAPRRARRL